MTISELLTFMRGESTPGAGVGRWIRAAQAAMVGIVVTDRFEIFFDTLRTSRKAANLRENPAVALVIGSTGADAERTLQYEGIADVPGENELEGLLELYFDRFPDGRDGASADVMYIRVRPSWIRYSNFAVDPPGSSSSRPPNCWHDDSRYVADQTASSLPLGSAKWNRRPPGNVNGSRTIRPPADCTDERLASRSSEYSTTSGPPSRSSLVSHEARPTRARGPGCLRSRGRIREDPAEGRGVETLGLGEIPDREFDVVDRVVSVHARVGHPGRRLP